MKKLKRSICIVLASLILTMAPVTSYMEAQAVEVLGGLALMEILKGLLVTAGVTAVGYVTVREGQEMKEKQEALERAILAEAKVSAALEDAVEWERTYGNTALKEDYTYTSPTGFRVINGSGNNNKLDKGITVGLNSALVEAAKNAAKSWADSEANNVKVAADSDKAGTEKVDSQYMSSIITTVKSIPAIDSMTDMDTMFGVDGACGYFKSRGYSDTSHYWLIYAGGSSTIFMPVPYGYSVVGYHASWGGAEGKCIISNANYKNSIVQCGVRDSPSFLSYLRALPQYTGRYYRYNVNSSEWSEIDGNYIPYGSFSDGFRMSNWYTCGYKGSHSGGSLISWNNYASTLRRTLYTYDSVGKFFTYDYSKAPSIPETGYEFLIPEADYAGFGDRDLASLISYISSLSEALKNLQEEQEKNQEELIQQGKDTLEAINNMHVTIGKISASIGDISTDIGKLLLSVQSIENAVNVLPDQIADALSASIVLPGLDELTTAVTALPETIVNDLTDILPDIITESIATVFPRVDELTDAVIALPDTVADALADVTVDIPDVVIPEVVIPEIAIPEIDIPEITIPEIAAPDVSVTLNPSYDITVANDFTGLGSIISSAIEAVLAKCFIPNESLTIEKFSEMQKYFKFKDDLIAAVGDLKTMLFGITPSPILKIPIGKPTSRKYNYGTGSYIIIDISWYAAYKQFGDKIILAIVWALFLWRMFIKLPGTISGVEGTIMTADRSAPKHEKFPNASWKK